MERGRECSPRGGEDRVGESEQVSRKNRACRLSGGGLKGTQSVLKVLLSASLPASTAHISIPKLPETQR